LAKTWLWELRWPEVARYLEGNDSVLLPVGSTEQHGPHLPLGVDALTAIALARDAGERSGTLVAAPVWYGWAPQHMGAPGTVTLRPETLAALVADVGLSLVHHGFRRIVVVNGHRIANLPPLQLAVSRIREATGALALVVDPVWLAEEVFSAWARDPDAGGIGHADGYETAHMLHLHPELVDMAEAPPAAVREGNPFRNIDPYVAGNRAAYWPSVASPVSETAGGGASGNPRWGDAEKGRVLHEALVANLVVLLASIREEPVDVSPAAHG
jgi:creatinine amidohydrolase